jgi:ABC-type multidrug transport system ATPase subunit
MTLAGKKGEDDRKLLDGVWGEVPAKQTTAIMGPSGAGKPSLLNILAGRAATRGNISIEADVRLNNYKVDPTNMTVQQQIAFVAQDDSLPVMATPREAIRFSARLRLPRSTTAEEIESLTSRMLRELGLEDCTDTIVGGALRKGISGGQRKRTSVGVELVTKPSLVFLDEPTSGLDSYSAVQLVQVLKKVAKAGSSVLFTIHQPSSEIFSSFDHLILMNKGHVMYQGAVTAIPGYFAERNNPVPAYYNISDHIMAVAQRKDMETLEAEGFFPEDDRKMPDPFDGEEEIGRDALGNTTRSADGDNFDPRPAGVGTQLSMLFKREFNHLKRDTGALATRFGITIFLAVLIGTIFLGVGATSAEVQSNVQSRWGALITILLMAMFGTADDALQQFPSERPVFLREYSTNHYSVFSYFTSRLTIEALLTFAQMFFLSVVSFYMIDFQMDFTPFLFINYALAMVSSALAVALGSAADDPKLATEMLPLLFVPQMLFAGFFVATDLIPSWLRWAQYLCSLTYALRLSVLEEFADCEPSAICESVIEQMNADEDESYWYWLVLVALFVVFRLTALWVLTQKSKKFY